MSKQTVDLVVKNGKIVTSYDIFEGGVAIDEGKIVLVAKDSLLPNADNVVDAKGNFILPGIVDVHVHVQDPGFPQRDDFEWASKAAAAGGVTTFMDMPTNVPPTTTVKAFNEKKELAEKNSIVDFALWGAPDPDNLENLKKLAEAGAVGFKGFMTKSVILKGLDTGTLLETFKVVKETGRFISVHAENGEIIALYTEKLKKAGRKDYKAIAEARPKIAELEATSRAVLMAKEAGNKLYIVHMSTPDALPFVVNARKEGYEIYAETCPHYLFFTKEDHDKLGGAGIMFPPLRDKEDVLGLWEAVRDGRISVISSDHSPCTLEEKNREVWDVIAGATGIETMLRVILSEGVNKGRITLNRLVQVMAETPARFFGVYPRKGVIQVGSDGDLTIVDLKAEEKITIDKLHYKAKYTPFEGYTLKGKPIVTIVRGEIVAKDGEIYGKPGYGRFIPYQEYKPSV